MNRIKNIFCTIILSAFAVSCVDLDYTEVTTADEEWIYKSPMYGIQKLVYNIYARVPNGFEKNYEGGRGATLAAATDEAECALSYSSVHRFYNGGWNPNNSFSFTWSNSYAAIAEANIFHEKRDKINLDEYKNNLDFEAMKKKFELFEYEVRFLRAYFYFELVRAYGDVPFTLKTLTVEEANRIERTSAIAIMDWIAEELDAIVEYLPISFTDELSPETGRANRMMCLALKARTLLYKASPLFNNENNKEWWLDAVRANGEVLLRAQEWGIGLDRYSKIWGPRNGDGIEMIWAIKRGTSNYWESYNYPIGVENANGGMCPTQTLVDNYEYNDGSNQTFGERHSNAVINLTQENPYADLDPRFFMTVVKNGDIWPNYNPNPIETFIGGLNAAPIHNSTPTGYYLRKYCDPNVSLATNNPTTSPHAWVVMRLGEFILNYAEAMFQYYGDAEAKGEGDFSANDAINLLRDRADVMMPHWSGTSANWFERYKRERMVELAFEDQRFWDVRRWKCGSELSEISIAELQKNASGDIILTRKQEQRRWEDKYYLFPIPFSEYNKNKNLGQNPGWN